MNDDLPIMPPSPITHHPSPITYHPSPITHHPSPITHHPSPITYVNQKNMYIIAVYDINQKRVGKMLKLSRRYLNWIQNSVFEGELSELKLKEYMLEAKKIMDESEDSLIIFSSRNDRWLEKQIVGVERNALDNIL